MAPSHHLNQSWLIITRSSGIHLGTILLEIDINHYDVLKSCTNYCQNTQRANELTWSGCKARQYIQKSAHSFIVLCLIVVIIICFDCIILCIYPYTAGSLTLWQLYDCNCHDDVIKWKHFPRYWPFVWGIHQSPVNSPHKGQWRGALMFSLICAWINVWVNNH